MKNPYTAQHPCYRMMNDFINAHQALLQFVNALSCDAICEKFTTGGQFKFFAGEENLLILKLRHLCWQVEDSISLTDGVRDIYIKILGMAMRVISITQEYLARPEIRSDHDQVNKIFAHLCDYIKQCGLQETIPDATFILPPTTPHHGV